MVVRRFFACAETPCGVDSHDLDVNLEPLWCGASTWAEQGWWLLPLHASEDTVVPSVKKGIRASYRKNTLTLVRRSLSAIRSRYSDRAHGEAQPRQKATRHTIIQTLYDRDISG
jgi:DNA topoisomerase IA